MSGPPVDQAPVRSSAAGSPSASTNTVPWEQALLEVQRLTIGFDTARGRVNAVRGVSLEVRPGERVGLVGESGSGKSVTAQALMGLLAESNTHWGDGEIRWKGKRYFGPDRSDYRELRGGAMAMVFQEPMTALNPVYTVGSQVAEAVRASCRGANGDASGDANGCSRAQARKQAEDLMVEVGIPRSRFHAYSHELSGGMRQRIVIAIALALRPALLIADEPTTALDVTVQSQIMKLIDALREKRNMALLLITHNLALAVDSVDRILVMYAGKIVEEIPADRLFSHAKHPYTLGLLRCLPDRESGPKKTHLPVLEGVPPNPILQPDGCPFLARCGTAKTLHQNVSATEASRCKEDQPLMALTGISKSHRVACWYAASDRPGDPVP